MNSLLQTLSNDTWLHVVQALLHSIWIGLVVVIGLQLALRRTVDPRVRYRACMGGLGVVLVGGVIAWGVLEEQAKRVAPAVVVVTPSTLLNGSPQASATEGKPEESESGSSSGQHFLVAHNAGVAEVPWSSWCALAWLIGSLVMICRSGVAVARAERLCRRSVPLQNDRISALIDEVRTRLGIVRQVRVLVAEHLSSPAVMGVLWPTLLLPASIISSTPLHQLQLIVLHELSHVRRGDYLINLCQLLIESILFFNPAVWWMSAQIRREREACCDAIVVELTGTPAEYARTLADVADAQLSWSVPPVAVPFGEERSSSLRDRVRRILIPGYRPGLGLTWKGLFSSLLFGWVLLLGLAAGTRVTVSVAAELLTPEQRLTRISENVTARVGALEPEPDYASNTDVRALVTTEDGGIVPKDLDITFYLKRTGSSGNYGASETSERGVYTNSVPRGDTFLAVHHRNFAPASLGPIDTRRATNITDFKVTLTKGFSVSFEVLDAISNKPLSGATVKARFWLPSGDTSTYPERSLTTDEEGDTTLDCCAKLPLTVRIEKNGYELTSAAIKNLEAGRRYTIRASPTLRVSGQVLSAATGKGIPNAEVYIWGGARRPQPTAVRTEEGDVIYDKSSRAPYIEPDPWEPFSPVTKSDATGLFVLENFPLNARHNLLIASKGYSHGIVEDVRPGQTNIVAKMESAIVVTGKITNLSALRDDGRPAVYAFVQYADPIEDRKTSHGRSLSVTFAEGVGTFVFTNRFRESVWVELEGKRHRYSLDIGNTWNLTLAERKVIEDREVVIRFDHASGVAPRGTVTVSTRAKGRSQEVVDHEIVLTNGQVRAIAREGVVSVSPAKTIGYWFPETDFTIPTNTAVNEPIVFRVPVVPAGAVYASVTDQFAQNASPPRLSLIEIERSPHVTNAFWISTDMDGGVNTPVPLGGKYAVRALRGNSVAVSETFALTEQAPEHHLRINFTPPRIATGRWLTLEGAPMVSGKIELSWSYKNQGIGLGAIVQDSDGKFEIPDLTPSVGEYRLRFVHPGYITKSVSVDLEKAMEVRSEKGIVLQGKVVEQKSGLPIPNAKVMAFSIPSAARTEQAVTDASGAFKFDTLSDLDYQVLVPGADTVKGGGKVRPGGQPITLEVVLSARSDLRPTPPKP